MGSDGTPKILLNNYGIVDMIFNKKAMIAAFLAELNEDNQPATQRPRHESESEFFRLLQLNVSKGACDQDYCDLMIMTVANMDDETFSDLCETMKNKFPNLEV